MVADPIPISVESPERVAPVSQLPASAEISRATTTGERLLIPRSQITNKDFQVPDVADAQITRMLNLPPRFSLACQGVYQNFFEKDYDEASSLSVSQRTDEIIRAQVKVIWTSP